MPNTESRVFFIDGGKYEIARNLEMYSDGIRLVEDKLKKEMVGSEISPALSNSCIYCNIFSMIWQ